MNRPSAESSDSLPFVWARLEACHAQHTVSVVYQLSRVGIERGPCCLLPLRGLGWTPLIAGIGAAVA